VPDTFLRYPIRGQKFSYSIEVQSHILSRRTAFQQIDVYATEAFGKILTLDGHVQLSTFDEAAYHEALVQIPLISLDLPTRALVVGGGDGGVLRELCRSASLTTIDMVEIDQGVVDACQEVLPELSAGAFQDARVHLYIQDAFRFLEEVRDPYDLIIMDITDTYEGEEDALSGSLFSEKFYLDIKAALGEKGFLVMQADNHVFCPGTMRDTMATLRSHFAHAGTYQALVPSFGGFSGYCWASKGADIRREWLNAAPDGLVYLNAVTYALAMHQLAFS
jgi:spermidine synthase